MQPVKTEIINLEYNQAVLLIKALNGKKHKSKAAACLATSRHKLDLMIRKYGVGRQNGKYVVTVLPKMNLKPGVTFCANVPGIKLRKYVEDKTHQN